MSFWSWIVVQEWYAPLRDLGLPALVGLGTVSVAVYAALSSRRARLDLQLEKKSSEQRSLTAARRRVKSEIMTWAAQEVVSRSSIRRLKGTDEKANKAMGAAIEHGEGSERLVLWALKGFELAGRRSERKLTTVSRGIGDAVRIWEESPDQLLVYLDQNSWKRLFRHELADKWAIRDEARSKEV